MRLDPDAPPDSSIPLDAALLALLPVPTFAFALLTVLAVPVIWDCVAAVADSARDTRLEREEQELDRHQAAAREAILRLADAIAHERVVANEAGAELVRAAYRASGTLPSTR